MIRHPARSGYLAAFVDRLDAGARLASRLERYRGPDTLVLGIPRGGVPVAAEVARHLNAELDVVVARKVGAPGYPELAIGAVTANGGRFLNTEIIRDLAVSPTDLHRAIAREMDEARRREELFRDSRPPSTIKGRVVLIVDDGLATGATVRAAVRSIRSRQPARLVVAVPVGSREACDALLGEVDELVCLRRPEPFIAVGLYYTSFEPVSDAEVQRILQEARAGRPGDTGASQSAEVPSDAMTPGGATLE